MNVSAYSPASSKGGSGADGRGATVVEGEVGGTGMTGEPQAPSHRAIATSATEHANNLGGRAAAANRRVMCTDTAWSNQNGQLPGFGKSVRSCICGVPTGTM